MSSKYQVVHVFHHAFESFLNLEPTSISSHILTLNHTGSRRGVPVFSEYYAAGLRFRKRVAILQPIHKRLIYSYEKHKIQ